MTARGGAPLQINPMFFHSTLSARCHLVILCNVPTADGVFHSVKTSMLDLYPLLRPQPQGYITFDLDFEKALGLLV